MYRKLFPASGVVRGDARQYVAGDDVRFMNWNVTAKTGIPFVDNTRADSGNDIIFALDVSESMKFGTRRRSKIAMAMGILSPLFRLTEMNGDKAGLVLFSDGVEKYFPPQRGTQSFLHAITNVVFSERKLRTDLSNVLRTLNKVIKKHSSIILVCDVFSLAFGRKSILSQLHLLGSKHDVTLFAIVDDNDMPSARIGRVTVEDAESGEMVEINTNDRALMKKIKAKFDAYQRLIFNGIKAIGIESFQINAKDSPLEFLFSFLR
jgi:uncharacterized protein (DUF58 family)